MSELCYLSQLSVRVHTDASQYVTQRECRFQSKIMTPHW